MSYGPYHDRGGFRYVYGSDGRWWRVLYSSNGEDYGIPVETSLAHSHHMHRAHPVRKAVSAFHTKPAALDPWQGNDYARELFQGQGARYFIGADHLVVRTTEIAALVYTAAFLMPELLSATSVTVRISLRPGVTVIARLYGRYLATAVGGSVAVLGRFPEYLDDAQELEANVFKMSMRAWNVLDWFDRSWTANQSFIDRAVQTGQRFYLATPPIGQDGSIYERELLYLQSLGVGPELWLMVHR